MRSNHKSAIVVLRLVKIQLTMGLLAIVGLSAISHNLNAVFSGIIGLFLAIIPTIVYARIAFGTSLVVRPGVAYSRHKKAMVGRFILNLLLFAIVLFFYKKCDYIALFITYFLALAGYWVSLVIV